MSEPERITAAAITIYGMVISLPPPARHHTLLRHFSELRPDLNPGPRGQGFLTSTGRYVGRREGAEIAIAAGQIDKLDAPPNLFSEDLW